jgi:hypothetical protein
VREVNPVIRGVINYYCKFWSSHTQPLWRQLNKRLQKWVQWEKGLYTMASARWLKQKFGERPGLFAHWKWYIRRFERRVQLLTFVIKQEEPCERETFKHSLSGFTGVP